MYLKVLNFFTYLPAMFWTIITLAFINQHFSINNVFQHFLHPVSPLLLSFTAEDSLGDIVHATIYLITLVFHENIFVRLIFIYGFTNFLFINNSFKFNIKSIISKMQLLLTIIVAKIIVFVTPFCKLYHMYLFWWICCYPCYASCSSSLCLQSLLYFIT